MPTFTEGNSKSQSSGTDNSLAATTERLKISESLTFDMVLDIDSDENADEEVGQSTNEVTVKRIAKKSTATVVDFRQPPAAATRRQVALANSNKKNYSSHDKFMENFDPESSARERRKLNRKVNAAATTRKVPGAVYDENGVHMATGIDLCDCLQKLCPGCHMPCPKCRSSKCGPECRCNRRFAYEQIEYHGCDLVIKNPLNK